MNIHNLEKSLKIITNDYCPFNIFRPWQNGRRFADDIVKCIFIYESVWISLQISLQFVPMDRINNILAFVQIIAWRRPGVKPLSEPMMVRLLTHIYIYIYIFVIQPQWVNIKRCNYQCLGTPYSPKICSELQCLICGLCRHDTVYHIKYSMVKRYVLLALI